MKKLAYPLEKVWFREPWPWLLASGPLLVVVASIVSAWIAIKSNDGLVSEDYYRQGLAAQETISRSDKASALELSARARITSDSLTVRLSSGSVGNKSGFQLPPKLRVTILHPTRAGLDQTLVLSGNEAVYSGKFRLPSAGHWLVLIEDAAGTWRMMGSVLLPADGDLVIGESQSIEMPHP